MNSIDSLCYCVLTGINQLGSVLRRQGKLEEAETTGQNAVAMSRISPNKNDRNLASGKKPVFTSLSLQDTYVVQVLSIDVFNCQFNSSVLPNSPDMGILSCTVTVAALLTQFECCCLSVWNGMAMAQT